ncbi:MULTISPECIES: branched-chain amino acid transport system II carrier protein [Lysinibacillus]|uniref:Branched-chain amino acid transport system carrier protein n=1 Tax=Lysinibacillus xylanilyticus TaxID=582475 RepID=A0ABV3W1W1_9BACI
MKNKTLIDSIIIGFATFAIFFGAGNLIFPPFIGFTSGTEWIPALLGMTLTGVILPVLGIVAVSNSGGTFADLTKPIAPWFYKVFCTLIMIVIGTFINVPRTAGTSYEIAIQPFFPNFSTVLFSIIFFAIVFIVSANKAKVIDLIGKFFTPFKFGLLLVIVVVAIFSPIGNPISTNLSQPFLNAFVESYQTADVLTGLLVANIIIAAIRAKGYAGKELKKITIYVSAIAGFGLFIIYGGLLYLGASGSQVISNNNIERTSLLVDLMNKLMGQGGLILLALCVLLACLVTAIGLTSACSDFMTDLTKNKIPYTTWVAINTIISAIFANVKVDALISAAAPIFLALYPISITLVILGLCSKYIPNRGSFIGTVCFTFIFSLNDAFNAIGIKSDAFNSFVAKVPFSSQGFTWLIPAIVGFIAGTIIYKIFIKKPSDTITA